MTHPIGIVDGHTLANGQSGSGQHQLGRGLVHRQCTRQHAGSNVGQTQQFQCTLHRAVFTERAMEHGKYHVAQYRSARSVPQQAGPRQAIAVAGPIGGIVADPIPLTVPRDPDGGHPVFRAIQCCKHASGRQAGDVVLAALATKDHTDIDH